MPASPFRAARPYSEQGDLPYPTRGDERGRKGRTVSTLWYSERFLDHDTAGLSEGPERLTAVWEVLNQTGLPLGYRRCEPAPATVDQIARIHRREVIERLRQLCEHGGGLVDPAPTYACPASFDVALLAAGAAIAAAVSATEGEAAFALVRPPGHHATPTRSMGF